MFSGKTFLLILCAVGASVLSGAQSPPANVWEFCRNEFPQKSLSLRGKTTLSKAGLHIPLAGPGTAGGAVVRKGVLQWSENAFSIEAEVVLDAAPDSPVWKMILDNKYVPVPGNKAQEKYHKGVMFFLMPRGNDMYRPGAAFGFGKSSSRITGKDIRLTPGVPYTLKLLFTGASKAEIFLNGKKISSHAVPALPVVPADVPAVIGDRVGSNYYPFRGHIRKLVIKKEKFAPAAFMIAPEVRRVFERGEKDPRLTLQLRNALDGKMEDLTVKAVSAGRPLSDIVLKSFAGKSVKTFEFPVDPKLLPGEYTLALQLRSGQGRILCEENFSYTIVPAYGDFLPVILWGNHTDLAAIRKAGFTHQMVHLFPRTGNFQKSSLKQWVPHLDENLKAGLYTFGNLHGHFRFLQSGRFLRKDKNGKTYPRKNIEASNPAVRKEFAEAARTTLDAVGSHPAFDGVLINSEVRDSALPSYGPAGEGTAFRKFAGYDIPETVSGKSPLPYRGDPAFPWDRVISSRRKEYVFLRWFWLTGDGWNGLQSLLSKVMHDSVRKNAPGKRFFTFYDPAARVPPMWGSGGDVDMIGQWTYTYPDPIKIGQATDELIAMGEGRKGQKIGTMTQAIWYRSQTAPEGCAVKNPPAWLKEEKEARFISIAPDNLREAFWSKISRRTDALMYHGVGSLLMKTDHKLYRYTNGESRKVLEELSNQVIRPLGPALKRVPEKPFKAGILQSLAASFYAPKHSTFGWSKNWHADLHLALQWGHFQPGILYDEHLLNNKGLEALKVLFVPGLEVVTEEVLEALNRLRARGVIIVGDEFTLPALMTDLRIKSVARKVDDPAGTKEKLQKLGRELAAVLDRYGVRESVASNNDLVTRLRQSGSGEYVFVLNDKRTFGDYVGQWGLVQEKGLPNSGTVTVRRTAEAAYDLTAHTMIPLKKGSGQVSFAVDLAPGDGKVILLLPRPIAGAEVKLQSPGASRGIAPGEEFVLSCAVRDTSRNCVSTVLPVEVILTADNGLQLPGSGFYAAEQGKLLLKEVLPSNLPPAVKRVTATLRCLASGKTASVTFPVKR